MRDSSNVEKAVAIAPDQPQRVPLTLECCVCGLPFVWSIGEQRFYSDRGLRTPRRCPECRAHAKRESAAFCRYRATENR